jgi:uncharacterized protein (DUF58 family)
LASLLDEQFLRRLERLAFVARHHATGGIGGEHRSRAQASSIDFADYRHYVPRDDTRRIDWNVYARLGDLYIKLTEAREHLLSYLLLDRSASMDWGEPNKLSYARSLAAALGYVTLARNDTVSVACLGSRTVWLRDVRGRRRALDLLRFLDDASAEGRLDLGRRLGELRFGKRPGGRGGGQAVLLSDLLPPLGLEDGLDRLLAAQLEVIVIHVLSPQELEPLPGGDFEFVDAETGERVQVGLSLQAVAQYQQRLTAALEHVSEVCVRRRVRYVRVRTDEPIEDVIMGALRRGLILA